MKKKKLSALLLAFAMLLSLLPMGALAEEQPVSVTNWQGLVAAMETGGNVVLGSSLTAPDEKQPLVVPSGKSVTLDLNGFTIDGSALIAPDVLIVCGLMTLTDSSQNQTGMITGTGQDVAYVENGGSFTMEGGKINNNSGFGAVYVRVWGTFTVSGAPVIEGGVYLPRISDGSHSFITIGGNLAEETCIGVKMETPDVFTSGLSGKGTAANFASLDDNYTVIVDNGEAALSKDAPDPAVSPDPDWAELHDALAMGGTVKLMQDYTATSGNTPLEISKKKVVTLDLNGYTIDGSALTSDDVLVVDGTLTLTDSSTSGTGKMIADNCEYAVYVNGGQFTMEGGTITARHCDDAVFVGEDSTFSLSGAPVIEGGVYLYEGNVITIGGELTNTSRIAVLMDSPGVFTSGWSTYMSVKNPADYFTSSDSSYGVTLIGGEALLVNGFVDSWSALNTALSNGGYVRLSGNVTAKSTDTSLKTSKNMKKKVTLDLNGYTIDGSALTEDVVVLIVKGRLTLTDSSASGEGKMIASGGDGVIDVGGGQFTMTGGTITASDSDDAVSVLRGQFTMTGGTITASDCDAAVVVDENSTFSLSGAPVIDGGVYLYEGSVITIGGELTNTDHPIDVSVLNSDDETVAYGVFTSGWSTYMSEKNPADYFTSGNSSYEVTLTGGGEARLASPVTLFATPDVGNVSISPSGLLYAGDEVTLTAEAAPGYTFLGWYSGHWDNENWVDNDAAHPVCSTLAYTFTIMEDTELLAKYEANGSVSVTINGGSKYTINGAEKSDSCTAKYILGTDVTVAVDRTDFAYWANSYGKVLSRSPSYTFTVTGAQTVNAVFTSQVQNVATLVFQSMYGQIIARQELAVGDSMTIPGVPVRNGYDPVGWDMDGDGIYDNVQDTLSAAIQRGLGKMLTINPLYTLKNQTYTVTVDGGTGGGSYNQNDLVTVTANAPAEGKQFSHWAEGGKVLSYSESYSFFAEKDVTLTAVFVDNEVEVEPVGTTAIINTYHDAVNKTLTFVSMSTVPEGCKINVAGIIATSDAKKADAANNGAGFTAANADFVRGDSWNGTGYRYTWTVGNVPPDMVIYARAYLVYTDANGNQHTTYGDVVTNSYSAS